MASDLPKRGNDQRERRILDVAAELFVYYGYDKTTVGDIAREAGVSKGAIYLHFASKDALFEGLLARETLRYQARWLDLIEADPQGGTIGGMYKNVLYALNSSAFMAAMFRQDGRVLGNYLRKPDNLFRKHDQSTRFQFVKLMQDAGAMRQDMDPQVVAHIMNMLSYSLVALDEIMDSAQFPPVDAIIEGIADIMDRALTPSDGGDNVAGKAILRQLTETGRQQLEATQHARREQQ